MRFLSSISWKATALITVVCWGSYSFFLAQAVRALNNQPMRGLAAYTLCYWPLALMLTFASLRGRTFGWGGMRGVMLEATYAVAAVLAMISISVALSLAPHPMLAATIAYGALPACNGFLSRFFERYESRIHLLFWVGVLLCTIAVLAVSSSRLELAEIADVPALPLRSGAWVFPALVAPCMWVIYAGLQGKIEAATGHRSYAFLWLALGYLAFSSIMIAFDLRTDRQPYFYNFDAMRFTLYAAMIACAGTFASLHARSLGPSNAIVVSILFGGTPIISTLVGAFTGKGWSWGLFAGCTLFPLATYLIVTYGPRRKSS